MCGFDEGYENYPLLYFAAIAKVNKTTGLPIPSAGGIGFDFDYYATCVSKCPVENQTHLDCKPNQMITQQVCDEAASVTNPAGHIAYGSKNIFDKFCIPSLSAADQFLNSTDADNLIGEFGVDDIQQYYEDIKDARMVYLYCMGTCLVITVLYNVILKFFARLLVWLTILITGASLVAGSYFLTDYHKVYYVDTKIHSDDMGKLIQVACYILYGVTAIYCCMVLCMFQSINISIAVLKTSALIIIRNIRIMIIPIVSIAFTLTFVLFWIWSFGYLLSGANIVQPDTAPFKYSNS